MKLVTTQAGGTGKPTAIITTSQPGQTPSTILGISSVQPQVKPSVIHVNLKGGAILSCCTLYSVVLFVIFKNTDSLI